MYILCGLEIEYDPTVSILTENEKLQHIQTVYSMSLTQENRLQRHNFVDGDGSLPSVNLTTQKFSLNSHGSVDSFRGQFQRGIMGRGSWNNSGKLCSKFVYTVSKCYFRFNKEYNGPHTVMQSTNFSSSSNQTQMQALTIDHGLNKEYCWYPDSGATNIHVTNEFG